MNKTLYLMCGIPGSGKSTYILNQITAHGGTWISRDTIRFLKFKDDNDKYFSHEKEVFKEFVSQIQEAMDNTYSEDIYVDATHINKKSREKLFNKLNINKDKIKLIGVNFIIPLNTCLERNSKREGRRKVPESAIIKMYEDFEPITTDEGFEKVIKIDADGKRG